ncbi:MAG: tyrosine--tRNA ligase [Candidatus Nealsonbacteria bacterium]|nr:tyrosine--tRNA ligase [Candidatus Nealsonbacteria bacterium]
MKNKDVKIKEAVSRAVEIVYPSSEKLTELLNKKKKIRLYCGYDPTSPYLHIGHLVTFLKLADFQTLGHEVIILIGDFTGMIGDPTDKKETRVKLTREQVLNNSKNYKRMASKVLDFEGPNPAKILYNSQWNDSLSFSEVIGLASNFTVQQMMARDMFQDRINRKKPIYLHEFLYPLVQGYDSVAIDVDLEIGGQDQIFNMLCGRDLMKNLKKKEKFVLGMKLLVTADGKKMGKTEGGAVSLEETPSNIYGTIMSWPDESIISGLEILTRISMEDVLEIKESITGGKINPMEAKSLLAKEIVTICYDSEKAEKAEKDFGKVFKKKELPSQIPTFKVKEKSLNILNLLLSSGLVSSKAEGKRLIEQGGVKIEKDVQLDWKQEIMTKKGMVIQVGKRKFAKID